MKTIRRMLFWIHLACGVAAGALILVMSVSGALLAFKPQIVSLVDRHVRIVDTPGAPRLGVTDLLARVQEARPDARLVSVTVDAAPAASIAVGTDRGAVYVDPYSGRVLGTGSTRTQELFRTIENWHRWLAMTGDARATGRALNDAGNLVFLALAVTGLFLWWPHRWLSQHVKAILWFRRASTGRARDFNWHNVIGFWCASVLIVLTGTGVIMSYPWANNLLYRVSGSPLPNVERGPRPGPEGARRGGPPRDGRGERDAGPAIPRHLDDLLARTAQMTPAWQSMTVRFPSRREAPVVLSIGGVSRWNAFARSQVTFDAETGEVVAREPYENLSLGQRMRQWARFAHTGELGGWPGQAIAGLACVGGAVLVWTGIALAIRRLATWTSARPRARAA